MKLLRLTISNFFKLIEHQIILFHSFVLFLNVLAQRADRSSSNLTHSDVTLCLVLDLDIALSIAQLACTKATINKAAKHARTIQSRVPLKFQKFPLSPVDSSDIMSICAEKFKMEYFFPNTIITLKIVTTKCFSYIFNRPRFDIYIGYRLVM